MINKTDSEGFGAKLLFHQLRPARSVSRSIPSPTPGVESLKFRPLHVRRRNGLLHKVIRPMECGSSSPQRSETPKLVWITSMQGITRLLREGSQARMNSVVAQTICSISPRTPRRIRYSMGDLSNPQSLNKYSYTYNNPVNLTEEDGQIPLIGVAIVVAVAVAILSSPDTTNAPRPTDPVYPSGDGVKSLVGNAALGAGRGGVWRGGDGTIVFLVIREINPSIRRP
jgi:hypothetical protein